MMAKLRVNRNAPPSAAAKRIVAKAKAGEREWWFLATLRTLGVCLPVREWRFHETRKWRFDYAWLAPRLALEVQGGVWTGGKHGRGAGIVKDHEKANAAAVLGWRILYCTPTQLTTPAFAVLVRDALANR